MLDRARIPLRRRDRGPWDPVIVMGGSCASINPLPMSEFVDVFAIGAAENVLPELLAALEEEERPRRGHRAAGGAATASTSPPSIAPRRKATSSPSSTSWSLPKSR